LFSAFRFHHDGGQSIHCRLLSPLLLWVGSEQEATSHSRVGQSHRMNAHDATMAVVATTDAAHRQHSAATVAITPPGAGPEGMLKAACTLLRNPLGPGASPSTAEQWHHDVDQLIIAVINTPLHGGRWANHSCGMPKPYVVHSRTSTTTHVPLVVRTLTVPRAPVASLTTADLRAELEHPTQERMATSPSSTTERGAATSTVTLAQ
jgi:hypothetical protein